jgi:hypothetical protein
VQVQVQSGKANKVKYEKRRKKMGRKQKLRRQQRRAEEQGRMKTIEDEQVRSRIVSKDDKEGGKETAKEDEVVQNRIERAEERGKKIAEQEDEKVQNGIGSEDDELLAELSDEYPVSDLYKRSIELRGKDMDTNDALEAINLNYRLAIECGCVHSMYDIGYFFYDYLINGRTMHLAPPWLLEGAIRGSYTSQMLLTNVYQKAKPEPPQALMAYWLKMNSKFNNYNEYKFDSSYLKNFKNKIGRFCIICSKTDTKTLSLQQCKGCSFYCYCGETCQMTHWEEHNHRGECKQLNILNKYHKPYAKEKRDAAINGETHPALDKLRYKLGLSRPVKEYNEL